MSYFCDQAGVLATAFQHWRRSLGRKQPERSSRPTTPVFRPLNLLSRRAVVIRLAAGGVVGIPGDRTDLIQIAITAMSAERQPC